MRISCVTSSSEISDDPSELIVFPEYSDVRDLRAATLMHPGSIIVGAVERCRRSVGVLLHQGVNRIAYTKVESDGRTICAGNLPKRASYETPSICTGVAICMDIDQPDVWLPVVDRLRASAARYKILCVPSDMRPHWFSGDRLANTGFEGVNVVVCNSTSRIDSRRCSFMTDTHGNIIVQQTACEPIHLVL
jgi:predicted amidohydrolase